MVQFPDSFQALSDRPLGEVSNDGMANEPHCHLRPRFNLVIFLSFPFLSSSFVYAGPFFDAAMLQGIPQKRTFLPGQQLVGLDLENWLTKVNLGISRWEGTYSTFEC